MDGQTLYVRYYLRMDTVRAGPFEKVEILAWSSDSRGNGER